MIRNIKCNSILSIASIGDVFLAYIDRNKKKLASDQIKALLQNQDITMANLEYVVKDNYVRQHDVCLVDEPETILLLKDIGVNIVSLANNHILDYGIDGLKCTRETLSKYSIGYCGAGLNMDEAMAPFVILRKGKKVAFFGCVLDDSFSNIRSMVADAKKPGVAELNNYFIDECIKFKNQVDYIVIFVHWGMQGVNHYTPCMNYYSKRMKEKGVDVILGSHSHVLGGSNLKENIFYDLGNFFFAPVPDKNSYDGLLYGSKYSRNRISALAIIELGRDSNEYISSDVLILYQDIDEIVKVLDSPKCRKLKKNVVGEWARFSYLMFQLEWRQRTIERYIHDFKVACIYRRKKQIVSALTKGLFRLAYRMVQPISLG